MALYQAYGPCLSDHWSLIVFIEVTDINGYVAWINVALVDSVGERWREDSTIPDRYRYEVMARGPVPPIFMTSAQFDAAQARGIF